MGGGRVDGWATPSFNSIKLHSHIQPSPGWPSLHQHPRPLVRLGFGKSTSECRPFKPG